jgi:hypothetical protein
VDQLNVSAPASTRRPVRAVEGLAAVVVDVVEADVRDLGPVGDRHGERPRGFVGVEVLDRVLVVPAAVSEIRDPHTDVEPAVGVDHRKPHARIGRSPGLDRRAGSAG